MSLRLFSFNKRVAVAGVLSALATGPAVLPVSAGQTAGPDLVSPARGKALFAGAEPMFGHIREHDDTLPAAVVTCSNCHASHDQPAVTGSDAPILSADFLTTRRSRRHGPASAYDERSLCLVLRTGHDPVYVLLDHVMPIYVVGDAQCQSLWRFLVEPEITVVVPDSARP